MCMTETTLVDRAVLRLSGEEVRPFLQSLVTGDVMALAPNQPLWSGLLTAQGKALFDFILWQDGEDVLIDCEAQRADDLAKRLSLYKLRRAITIARDDELAVHWQTTGAEGVDDPRLASIGRRWLAPASAVAEGYHRHRIALGAPEGMEELGVDKTLWLETNAVELNGVSFTKGCYVGQENTARMYHRSKVRRRLLPVHIIGDAGNETALVTAEGKSAGEVRRQCGDVAMAWLRMDYVATPLLLGEARAHVLLPKFIKIDDAAD